MPPLSVPVMLRRPARALVLPLLRRASGCAPLVQRARRRRADVFCAPRPRSSRTRAPWFCCPLAVLLRALAASAGAARWQRSRARLAPVHAQRTSCGQGGIREAGAKAACGARVRHRGGRRRPRAAGRPVPASASSPGTSRRSRAAAPVGAPRADRNRASQLGRAQQAGRRRSVDRGRGRPRGGTHRRAFARAAPRATRALSHVGSISTARSSIGSPSFALPATAERPEVLLLLLRRR